MGPVSKGVEKKPRIALRQFAPPCLQKRHTARPAGEMRGGIDAVNELESGAIPLLGKGGVRGGLVHIRAELFWKLTEPPLAPPLPRRGMPTIPSSFTPQTNKKNGRRRCGQRGMHAHALIRTMPAI